MSKNIKSYGTSLLNPESMKEMKKKFEANRKYWDWLEQKKGNHVVVKNVLWNMQELSKEFLIIPCFLEKFFFIYLNEKHPSQQNKQLALNIARVFSLISHQYYKSATKFNMVSSFYVSPSVWDKFLIGRKAKDSSITILEEIGVITSYCFNRNKFAPPNESRFVIMYQFNLEKVRWLHACIKSIAYFEESKQEGKYEGRKYCYEFEDVIDDVGSFENFIENEKYAKIREEFK